MCASQRRPHAPSAPASKKASRPAPLSKSHRPPKCSVCGPVCAIKLHNSKKTAKEAQVPTLPSLLARPPAPCPLFKANRKHSQSINADRTHAVQKFLEVSAQPAPTRVSRRQRTTRAAPCRWAPRSQCWQTWRRSAAPEAGAGQGSSGDWDWRPQCRAPNKPFLQRCRTPLTLLLLHMQVGL